MTPHLVPFLCLECGRRFRAEGEQLDCYYCGRGQAVRRSLLPQEWDNKPSLGPDWLLLVIVLAAWLAFMAAGFWALFYETGGF